MSSEGDRKRVVIYTDGGADPNPGVGGWGAILVDPITGRQHELSGGASQTTNNRMELTAAIHALEALKTPCRVELYTDSQYLRRGITEWLPGWIRRDFKRREGAVKNVDLWKRLAEVVKPFDIDWRWVKGHSGDPLNERADALATAAIRRQRGNDPEPSRPGTVVAENEPTDVVVDYRVSCSGTRGAWSAVINRDGDEQTLTGAESATTANRLDLLAVCTSLEAIDETCSVAIHTPSDYVRNGATMWIEGWRSRNWKTKAGGAVKNVDLWRRLEALLNGRSIVWPMSRGKRRDEAERLEPIVRRALAELR